MKHFATTAIYAFEHRKPDGEGLQAFESSKEEHTQN